MVQVGGSVHWIDYWADRGGGWKMGKTEALKRNLRLDRETAEEREVLEKTRWQQMCPI